MKKHFQLLFIALLAGSSAVCQVHITMDDPATWSSEVLRPYIGQTVIFDMPMIVSTNTGSTMTVSPWRRFVLLNQGVAGSDDYNETLRVNNSCMFSLSGVSGYHRCGEKIIGLKASVVSPTKLTWISGTWSGNTRSDLSNADVRQMVNIAGCDSCLLICGFNVENYFVRNLGKSYLGANNYSDHQKQRTKIQAALQKINADIFGFCELEQGDDAVKEIVEDLNKAIPSRNFRYFHDASMDANQKVDYVYDANLVEPIGTPAGTNEEVQNRKKIVCFRQIKTGERFNFSINHFKAMNTGDEYRRVNEAKAIVKLYNSYRQNRNVRDNDVLFMGDMNCYPFTEPILALTDNGMIDLHRAFHADSSYSYVHSGYTAYIDHALCNETLFRQVMGMSAFHINSDEDDAYTYDKSEDKTMFRCSDHDPVLVGLRLDSTLSNPIEPYFNGSDMGGDSVAFYCVYTPFDSVPLVYFDIYSINGFQVCPPTKITYEGDLFEEHTKYYTLSASNPNIPAELKRFLPLPPGMYVLHFYYKGTVTSHKLIVR